MINNLTPEEKYKELIERCGIVFAEWSKDKDEKYRKWKYALCATPIQPGKGIILGINWGVDRNEENYYPSKTMPDGSDIKQYHFINRSRKYLEKYLELNLEKLDFNYSNLCMFRTPKSNLLNSEAYHLCFPIFHDYLKYINPPWVLSLGLENYKTLKKIVSIDDFKELKKVPNKNGSAFRMRILNHLFYMFIHPSRFSLIGNDDLVDELWQETFND